MMLEELYQSKKATVYSLNEHMDTLRHYASDVDIVVEFGTYTAYSATAFLAAQPKELHCWDVTRQGEVDNLERLAGQTKFVFHRQSSFDAKFETTDLLFFDSLHTYYQLKRELELHAHKSTKYLIFHDVFAYAYFDEGNGLEPAPLGYSKGTHHKGLAPAMSEYFDGNTDWKIHDIYYHQSGLVVYKRV